MSDMQLFDKVTGLSSKTTTLLYSSSFSSAINLLHKDLRQPIYDIYGFVRFADEIVDTFHDYDKHTLFAQFKKDTYLALEQGISLNPILHRFQLTYKKYKIDPALLEAFLVSMEMDLSKHKYDVNTYQTYIYGSAEVVGLMCLRVFVKGNQTIYDNLTPYAMSLGSAFQKINFLRDLHADYLGMGRVYFPNVELTKLDPETKLSLENDIELDFNKGLEGIKLLPKDSRFGVYVAYIYYLQLFKKIKSLHPERIMEERIRIPNSQKMVLFASSYVRHSLNLL